MIERIRNTYAAHQIMKQEQKRTRKSDEAKRELKENISISSESRERNKILSMTKKEINNVSEVRMDKIEEVRKKIEEGFYDKPEVIAQVADRIIDLMKTGLL